MTSWAASSGDPFDGVRKFLTDMQDWWSGPRRPECPPDQEGPPDGDRWEQATQEGRDETRGRDTRGPRPDAGPFGRAPWADSGPGGPFAFPFGWPGGPGRGGWPGGPGRGWPGGPGRGRHGGPRGPRAGRGDVRLAILALLAEQPMHGYQLIQEISRRSAGAWKPSPGSVYPTLQQLEDEGLVQAQERDGKRVYELTGEGRALVEERSAEFASMWDGYRPDEEDVALGDLVFGVASAFVHVMRTGSDRQIAAARAVLARTRADLYKILGSEGDNGDSGAPAPEDAAPTTGGTDPDSGDTERGAGGDEDEWGDQRS